MENLEKVAEMKRKMDEVKKKKAEAAGIDPNSLDGHEDEGKFDTGSITSPGTGKAASQGGENNSRWY